MKARQSKADETFPHNRDALRINRTSTFNEFMEQLKQVTEVNHMDKVEQIRTLLEASAKESFPYVKDTGQYEQ